MAVICSCQLYFIIFLFLVFVSDASWSPKYVWPLGNSTVYKEVMEGFDGQLPGKSHCFVFSEGYPGLPYKALTLTGEDNSYVDFDLHGKEEFTDLAISLYIYPTGEPQGTILNYICETGNIIKLTVLQGLLFVSFWDEFGVSVGATAVPDLLKADTWSHLLVSREFVSGRIQIFHNGEVVEDIDDDFPNQIRLPAKGSIRLGSSQKDKHDIKFKGRFSCFQMYTQTPTSVDDIKHSDDYCKPDKWSIVPKMNLETRVIDVEERECVTDYIAAPQEDGVLPRQCDVIDMSCISSGVSWNWLLHKHHWTTSMRDTAHFRLALRDHIPQNEGTNLGNVVTKDKMVCSRLCLRVDGCMTFSVFKSSNTTRCVMYRNIPAASLYEPGAVFFTLA